MEGKAPEGIEMDLYDEDIMGMDRGFEDDHSPIDSGRRFIVRECVELNCNWGIAGVTGNAGACWQCNRLEPCCGNPCNAKSGIYCCMSVTVLS